MAVQGLQPALGAHSRLQVLRGNDLLQVVSMTCICSRSFLSTASHVLFYAYVSDAHEPLSLVALSDVLAWAASDKP
jgi:hypothetical protein